jgi:S-ribosylhomocysteine lyase LuxS involved in autoinducer biosynthesis
MKQSVEEEKKLVSAVEPFGTTSWAKIAANVPGRNEKQCRDKWHTANYKCLWHTMSTKEPVPTAISHWTREEENKLVSAVETFGTAIWAKIAANIPGRTTKQCWSKWHKMSTKKAAPTATSQWMREKKRSWCLR